MTYTATGFSNRLRIVFDAMHRPSTIEDTEQTVAMHFRVATKRSREDVHMVNPLIFGVLAARLVGAAQRLARCIMIASTPEVERERRLLPQPR